MYVLGGSRPSSGRRAGPTIYELNARGEGCSPRAIPRLVAAGRPSPGGRGGVSWSPWRCSSCSPGSGWRPRWWWAGRSGLIPGGVLAVL